MTEFSSSIEPPMDFVCPITSELMEDPLMTRAGLSFERSAILEWMSNHNNTCPLTRKPLRPSDLVPNAFLKNKIRAWKEENGVNSNDQDDESSQTNAHKNFQVFATFTIASANKALRRNPHIPRGTTMERMVEGICQ